MFYIPNFEIITFQCIILFFKFQNIFFEILQLFINSLILNKIWWLFAFAMYILYILLLILFKIFMYICT